MLDSLLSAQQLAVLSALSSGATAAAAAEQAGVHRNTICNWRRNFVPFQKALADAQYDRALLHREKAEALVDLAIAAIREILSDPAASPGVRLKAALAIMNLATQPPEPKKQVELLIETIAAPPHKSAQPAPAPRAPESPQAPAPPPPVHIPAQVTPIRREQPKVGRNETCPCGSGLKHKRCCIDKPVATAA